MSTDVVYHKPVYKPEKEPREGQEVIYFFEPFGQWYMGKPGFTSWRLEVAM